MNAELITLRPQAREEWPEQGEWTYEEWLRLPDDGFRYEVLDGELYMSPLPTVAHQNSVTGLTTLMRKYAVDHEACLIGSRSWA